MHYKSGSVDQEAVDLTQGRQWTYLVILLMVATSCYVDRGVLSVLLEPIKKEFHLSDVGLGLLSGPPFAICYALSSIPLGRLADATSRKNVLLLSLVTWSVLTGLCGFATGIMMLVILRMGVGAAEGGAVPPGHALIADYFPAQRRALAFAVFAAAPMLGVAIANGFGGWITQHYGWRITFFGMALLAAPIAILGALVLREPPRIVHQNAATTKAGFRVDLKALLAKPSFRLTILGSVLISFYNQGFTIFMPSMMIRSLGLTVAQAGALYGLSSLVGSMLGMIGSAVLGNYLARRGARSLLLMTVWAMFAATLFALLAFFARSPILIAIALIGIAAALTGCLPAIFTTIQHICGSSRRALADGFNLAVVSGTGITLGPVVTGLLSESYAAAGMGGEALRYAVLTMTLALPIAGLILLLATRHLDADAE